MSYESELIFAKELAREAGQVMLKYFRTKEAEPTWKPDDTPLTVADTTINDLVISRVKAAYPEDGILGEEASYEPARERLWVVDPIDGTKPYSLGMPLSTFSLALVDRSDGQSRLGVTFDPWLDELYYAVVGEGAFLNEEQIHTTTDTSLQRAAIAASSRSNKYDEAEYRAGSFSDAVRAAGGLTLGFSSFVYTANRVARGQLAGAIVGNAGAWDIAASSLLIQEAGGVVTDLTGAPRRFDEAGIGCVQAANHDIHRKMMELL